MQAKVTGIRPGQPQKDRYFPNVPWTAGQSVENWRELFGLRSDKESLSSVFSVDDCNDKANWVFGKNGIMTRTLDHRKEMIKQASILIDCLYQELLKARAEKESAEDREAIANLKLEQQKEMLWEAQQTLNAKEKDRDNTFDIHWAKKHVDTLLRALSMHKTLIEMLRNWKARPNQSGLTLSRPKD